MFCLRVSSHVDKNRKIFILLTCSYYYKGVIKEMTSLLAEDWNVSITKTIEGETYRIHAEPGRGRNPYGYSTESSAERIANTLRENGWNVRLYELPSWSGRYVLYTRRE